MNNLIQFSTSIADVVVVKLPEGAKAIRVLKDHSGKMWLSYLNEFSKGLHDLRCIDLSSGKWEYIGEAFELTEDQWSTLLPKYKAAIEGYLDYESGRPDVLFKGALQSGHSLLKANKIYRVNPYSNFECPNQWCENGYIDQGYNEKWRCDYCQENEDSEEAAEERTGTWALMFKGKGE